MLIPKAMMIGTIGSMLAIAAVAPAQRAPGVDVWFAGGNAIATGERAQIRYRLDRPAYATVVRADEDGTLRIMSPSSQAFSNSRSKSLLARDGMVPMEASGDGTGYVFVIGSAVPFDYRKVGTEFVVRRRGDPFEAIDRLARSIARRGSYSIAYAPFAVSGRFGDQRARGVGAVRYDDGYGGYGYYDEGDAYSDRWDSSRYRRGYDGYSYGFDRDPRMNDPRARYDRHCPDGTLQPYTIPCPDGYRRRWNDAPNTLTTDPSAAPGGAPQPRYPAPGPSTRTHSRPPTPTPPRRY